MKRFVHIIVLLLVAGCSYQLEPVQIGKYYILRQDSTSDSIATYSLWRRKEGVERLVSKFIVEDDTVVSLTPTPVSSDTVRPVANFVLFGNGSSTVLQMYLDENETLFKTSRGITELDEKGAVVKHPDLWKKSELPIQIQSSMFDTIEGNVYLVIQQGASFSQVKNLLKQFGKNEKIIIGIGWDPSSF